MVIIFVDIGQDFNLRQKNSLEYDQVYDNMLTIKSGGIFQQQLITTGIISSGLTLLADSYGCIYYKYNSNTADSFDGTYILYNPNNYFNILKYDDSTQTFVTILQRK